MSTEKQGINCTEGPLLSIHEVTEKLRQPFAESDIEWRVQRVVSMQNGNKAIVVPYVQNRAIQNRFDDVFGVVGWENEFRELHDGVICGISIWVNGRKITKWDGADRTNIEPTKGSISASMKRCAVQFGVGRYLYDLEEVWVDIKPQKQSQSDIFINDKKSNIKGFWTSPKLPNWALPNGSGITTSPNKQERANTPSPSSNNVSQNGRQPKAFNKDQALKAIYDQERMIEIPENYCFPLFKRANPNTTTKAIEHATEKELQEYYNILKPVAVLIAAARNYNLSLDGLLYYCQIVLKQQINAIPELFFKVTPKEVEQIIGMIRQESSNSRTA